MSTFGQLIDRTYREYLRPVEEQEPLTQVANTDSITGGTGLTSAGTSISYQAGLLTPEEEELIGAGSVIEIGQELIMVENINTVARTLTVERGRLGTTAAEHLDFERKALLSFYRNVGFDAKQLGYDPNDPRFIKQLIKLTAPQIKAELKSQRELFKATFREKVIEEEAYTFNTKIIESVKGANVINAAGERSDDTFFKDKGVVQQLAIQKTNGNIRKAEDLAFEIAAELVKNGDILPIHSSLGDLEFTFDGILLKYFITHFSN